MSAWKCLVRSIYMSGALRGTTLDSSALGVAKELGLIAHDERRRWTLTPLGREWCEGRVKQIEVRPGGRRWVATWLRSLPQDIKFDSTRAKLEVDFPPS